MCTVKFFYLLLKIGRQFAEHFLMTFYFLEKFIAATLCLKWSCALISLGWKEVVNVGVIVVPSSKASLIALTRHSTLKAKL